MWGRAWLPTIALGVWGLLVLASAVWYLDPSLYLRSIVPLCLACYFVPGEEAHSGEDKVDTVGPGIYWALAALPVFAVAALALYFVGVADIFLYSLYIVGGHVLLAFSGREAWRKLRGSQVGPLVANG